MSERILAVPFDPGISVIQDRIGKNYHINKQCSNVAINPMRTYTLGVATNT